MIELRPQAGPQEAFLKSVADIAIYGGAAGGGKTYALLLEPLYHTSNPNFGATIFRRTSPQILNEGGLWDTSETIYSHVGAKGITNPCRWRFNTGAKIEFHHMQHEKNRIDWQGAQIPLIGWDELAHFTEKQFFYLLSRNRSTCGVKPYVRATTNPDPDSFVKQLINWWLDDDDEYANQDKAGVLRWMQRIEEVIYWFDSEKEAIEYAEDTGHHGLMPKSVTFIPSSIYDNSILMKSNPDYLANLMALQRVERLQLLKGNWKVRAEAGELFDRNWFEIVDTVPYSENKVRCWDRASTVPSEVNHDPDWTAGASMSRINNTFFIEDMQRDRKTPGGVKAMVKNTASRDAKHCTIVLFKDPAQAGVVEIDDYITLLNMYNVRTLVETKKKYLRWLPLSAQAEQGRVKLLRAPWNNAFLNEAENVSMDGKSHDDQIDAASGAYEWLVQHSASSLGDQKSNNSNKKPITAGMRNARF